ncbi:MAG: HEAT repeat domain-containing protein [Planctomycetes bacterium]|nr:HEAT repeat domain-containing protein [Planctomycetota bacterium]
MSPRPRVLSVVLLLSGGVALLSLQTALGPRPAGERTAAADASPQPEGSVDRPVEALLEPEVRTPVEPVVHGSVERALLLDERIHDQDACCPLDRELVRLMRERLPLLDLIEASSSPDARVALAACEVLKGDPSAGARLKDILAAAGQRDAQDVCVAIEGIRHFPDQNFEEELRRLAVQGQEPPVRRLAVEALQGSAREVLLAAFDDPDWSVRHAALSTAPAAGALDAELAAKVRNLLADANPIVRAGARRLLRSP